MADATCPLCHLEAEFRPLQQNLDLRFRCERCGAFDTGRDIPANEIEYYTDPDGNVVGQRSHILSGLTRRATGRGERIRIGPDNIIALLDSV